MERICSSCGSAIGDGDRFCDVCGKLYEDDAASNRPPKAKSAEKKPTSDNHPDQAMNSIFPSNKTKLIIVAVAVIIAVAAIFIIRGITNNSPESALRTAIGCRLSGDVDGLAAIDYECNFSKNETKDSALTRMKGDSEMTKNYGNAVKLRIKSEARLIDDEKTEKEELTQRIASLEPSFNDTDKITDIRRLTYDLLEGETVKTSGTAEAIKVNGKWYIFGAAKTALHLA